MASTISGTSSDGAEAAATSEKQPESATTGVGELAETAHWVAAYRAQTTNSGQVPLDPYAKGLAGPAGERMVAELASGRATALAIAARTRIIDRVVQEAVATGGFDTVLNVGAGLDTRPQRLELARRIRWIEVDRGGVLAYKAARLPPPMPCYQLEQCEVDLSVGHDRRRLFHEIATRTTRWLVLTEGFVVYWAAEQVAELARDLANAGAAAWVLDLIAPKVLKSLQKRWAPSLDAPGRVLQFAPTRGARFFEPYGWREEAFWPLVSDVLASRESPSLLRKFVRPDESRLRLTGVARLVTRDS